MSAATCVLRGLWRWTMAEKITFFIDDVMISADSGMTIAKAAADNITINTLCGSSEYRDSAACMVCAVFDRHKGKFIPACSTLAEEGMDIENFTERVSRYRKTALELILSEHFGDCLAPCRRACPSDFNIPLFLEKLDEGDSEAAANLIEKENPPCAECSARCEKACRRKITDGESVHIKELISAHRKPDSAPPPESRSIKRGYGHVMHIQDETTLELMRRGQHDKNGCLKCQCSAVDNCRLRTLAELFGAKQSAFGHTPKPYSGKVKFGGLVYESGKCIRCGKCVAFSADNSIGSGLCLRGRGENMTVGNPLGISPEDCLAQYETTIADLCPVGALHREK